MRELRRQVLMVSAQDLDAALVRADSSLEFENSEEHTGWIQAVKALREAAKDAHGRHFLLGDVDRARWPTFNECPYWPCKDAARAIVAFVGAFPGDV